MLLKGKMRKYALLLLAMFLIFRIIPDTFANAECLSSCSQKTAVIFNDIYNDLDISFIDIDERKTTFHSIMPYNNDSSILYICISYVSENGFVYPVEIEDHFKDIKKMIPHHFHGSKYKEINFSSEPK